MELWDIYDEHRNLTGRTHVRGLPVPPGDYHLIVHIWIMAPDGRFLIQQRAPTVEINPGVWATTSGSAKAGDDSATTVVKEAAEELGLRLDINEGKLLFTVRRKEDFADIWLFCMDVDADSLSYQKEEVSAARWAGEAEIREMARRREFVPYIYLDRFFKSVKSAQKSDTNDR